MEADGRTGTFDPSSSSPRPPRKEPPECNPAISRPAQADGVPRTARPPSSDGSSSSSSPPSIGGNIGQKNLEQAASGNGDSKRGSMIIDDAGFADTVGERVLVQGKGSVKADSPEVTAAMKDIVESFRQDRGRRRHPEPARRAIRASTVSKDGHSVLVTYSLPAKIETRRNSRSSRRWSRPRSPSRRSPEGASGAARAGARRRVAAACPRAQDRADGGSEPDFSMGGTLVLLLLTFAAAVAASVPLLLGISSFVATTGLLGPVSQLARCTLPSSRCDAHRPRRRHRLRDVLHAPDDPEHDKGRSRPTPWTWPPRPPVVRCRSRVHRHGGDGRHVLLGNPIFSSFGIGTMLVVLVAMIGSLHSSPRCCPTSAGRTGWRRAACRTWPSAVTRTAESPAYETRSSVA